MKLNIGVADRIGRALFALIVAVLYMTNQITGTAALVLGLAAVILLFTSFAGFCPIYASLRVSTKETKSAT